MAFIKRYLQCCVYSINFMVMFRERSENEKLRKLLSLFLIPAGLCRYIYLSASVKFKASRFCNKSKCAIVIIVKNEARYMEEYFDFYSGMGCDILIYDNESTDGIKEIAEKYSNVKYHWWPGRKRQIDAYNHAINCYKYSYKYMMFFDADEYLVCDGFFQHRSLKDVCGSIFEKNERAAGVGVNWLIFGSSGYVDYPGGVVDSFLYCAEDDFERNQLVKSIVMPERIVGWVDPHLPMAVMGYCMTNVDGEKIVLPRNKLPKDRSVRLYHYFVKNRQHFIEKVNKGRATQIGKIDMAAFEHCDRNEIYNEKAAKLKLYLNGTSREV